MQEILELAREMIGLSLQPQQLSVGQVVARAAIIYLAAWIMIRAGDHRFLGRNTAFDIVLGFILGSLLSRAINGSGGFIATLAAGAVLLTIHWAFVSAAVRSGRVDQIVNGSVRPLIRQGKVDWKRVRRARLSERVLRENLRLHGKTNDPAQVEEADLEPSGKVSVIRRRSQPRIVEIAVEDGVQIVRIMLE